MKFTVNEKCVKIEGEFAHLHAEDEEVSWSSDCTIPIPISVKNVKYGIDDFGRTLSFVFNPAHHHGKSVTSTNVASHPHMHH